jgi:perosamine synthetase
MLIARCTPYLDSSEILAALHPGMGRSEFEAAVASYVGARYAVAFAYGHAGAIASFRALSLTDVDVVLPAYTCTTMADSLVTCGNHPRFADIDLTDFNMRLETMKAALTPQTRVVIATHMYGYPTDVDAIRDAVGDERVLIMEDRAMGLSTFPPGTAGLRSDLGLFSFGPSKHLFTVQGGIMATNSADLYEKIKGYRDTKMADLPMSLVLKRWARFFLSYLPFGRFISPYRIQQGIQRAIPPNYELDIAQSEDTLVAPDHDTRYMDFQARIGLSQLEKLDTIVDRRRKLAAFYDRELRGIAGLTPAPIVPGATYSHYTVRIERRDELGFGQRMRDKGVEVGQVYEILLPFRERFRAYADGRYPVAEQATRQVVNLPNHPRLRRSEAEYVVKCVRDILRQSV